MSKRDATYWTIAYRKPSANRFLRADDLATDWHGARAAADRFGARNPGLQVWIVTTAAADRAGYSHAEDIGNVLTDGGKRVRLADGGSYAAPATDAEIEAAYAENSERALKATLEAPKATLEAPASLACDYGPADEIATRVTDSGNPEVLCQAHAREHFGADWRTETRALTPGKIAALRALRA